MNQYILIGVLVALLAGTFFLGDRYGHYSATVSCDKVQTVQAQAAIVQQAKVISAEKSQSDISQQAENDYENNINAINNLYPDRMPDEAIATAGNVRTISKSTCGTQTSKEYKLTLKQCDEEEAKANALWKWARDQASVK